MPPIEKTKKPTAGAADSRAKGSQKASQRQAAQPGPKGEKEPEAAEPAAGGARERKASSKLPASASKERKSAASRVEARERKLTPQQQAHLARARRRQLNQRLGLGAIAVIVIVVIVVVVQQAITKNEEATRLANLHAAATSTAIVKATATENAHCPAIPPTLTETPVKLKSDLQYIDTTVGTGPAVKAGDTISVQYIGWIESTNVKFDCSYDHGTDGQPTKFQLIGGPNGVIQGWVDGIPGMKAGGKRRLIIPPALAYGEAGIPGQNEGDPPLVPPNTTLIFDVQLVSIDTASS
ncbi:MAG TPA: FKBP-type peptidyl-prolyl cis-trans isomerase [Ktedonobacterales bacterium]|jgi:FKBP-type peptidyl-prolyl cis-trans isomerase